MIPFINFWENTGIPNCWHPKSKTVTWFCTDTEENYNKTTTNLYKPDSFSYTFNQYGYRIDNKDWDLNSGKHRMIAIGCSNSVGVGVAWKNTWPYLVSQDIGDVELFNLSVAGASADTIFRTLHQSIDVIKPDIVMVLWPEQTRWELYESVQWDGEGIPCHTPTHKSVWNMEPGSFNESNLINLFNKNVELVRLLQRLQGFKLVECGPDFYLDYINANKHILSAYEFDSRDLIHPGVTLHQHIRKKFIDNYSKI